MKPTITQAVNRFYWRLGGNGNTKPFAGMNEQDVEAYTAIKDYVKETQEQQYEQNELFAKLFIYLYMKILQNNKSTVMDNLARKKIYSLLKKPLFQIVEDFQNSLNESEQYELIESIQGEIKHPALLSDQERLSNATQINEALKTPESIEKLLGKVWDYESVKDLAEAEVNQAINYFK